MTHPANTLSLVADIGGTNTRCALANGAQVLPDTVRRYANAKYPDLETVLRTYLADEGGVDTIAACVAVAGPVSGTRGTLTNLDWAIDHDTLQRASGAETVGILNDLQAQGHALDDLDPSAIFPIIKGPDASANTVRLVVGVGTGFNAAPVFQTETGIFVPPSESGHASLPTRTDLERRLSQYVSSAHGFPAIEDVCSGRGLQRVYRFLAQEAGEDRDLTGQEIMEAVARGDDTCARDAAALFTRVLGTVCGNLALIQLPVGGVYLVGGVACALAPHLAEFGFADAFRDKGRFANFMDQFAVSVVKDDYAALQGCASHIMHLRTV
ncbi:MAG: glucokinase [Octadecabacter sp.]